MLRACDDVCGYRKNRKCNIDMLCWDSGVKDEIQKKNEAYKELTINPTEEAKNEYMKLIMLPRRQLLEL